MKAIPTVRFALLGALAVAAVGLGLALSAARSASAQPQYSATAGGPTYRTYCANCHGADGRGKGEITESLAKKPGDLTRLTAANDGVFPAERVEEVIDGRVEVAAHGTREMPVWGDLFLWPEDDSPARREHVKRKIGELVAYLKSIQEPATKR